MKSRAGGVEVDRESAGRASEEIDGQRDGGSVLKLSVITDEVSRDLRRVVEFARHFRLEGLELRSVWDCPAEKLTREQIDEIRKLLAGTELVICAVASPFLRCDLDDREGLDHQQRILGRCIEIAEHLGCDLVRVSTPPRKGRLEDRFDQLAEVFQRALFLAVRAGVRLAVENGHATLVGTGQELAWFLERMNFPLLGACWDPQEHFICVGGREETRQGYEALRGTLMHVHLKDARIAPGGGAMEFAPIGEGEVGIGEQLRALISDGYRGFVSLETGWRPDVLLSEAASLDPGFPIATEAEYASWFCMARLQRLIEEMAEESIG
jgi:sugar phosphate isomerase/epimerase